MWSAFDSLFTQLGSSVTDLLIVGLVIAMFFFVRGKEASQKESIKEAERRLRLEVKAAEERLQSSLNALWDKYNDLNTKYHQLDKGVFGMAKIIQIKHPEVKIIKQSANGAGDYALDRSEE